MDTGIETLDTLQLESGGSRVIPTPSYVLVPGGYSMNRISKSIWYAIEGISAYLALRGVPGMYLVWKWSIGE